MFNNFHKAKLCIVRQYIRKSQGLPILNSSAAAAVAANDNHSLPLLISWVKAVCAPYARTSGVNVSCLSEGQDSGANW